MKKCKEDGCGRRSHTRGWCRMHYLRVQRHGAAHPDELVAALLDWILDGEGLTTSEERERHPEQVGVGL